MIIYLLAPLWLPKYNAALQHPNEKQVMTSGEKEINDIDVLRANINNETAQISWAELQRFFAGGWLIYVSTQVNLLDVAVAFTLDDKDRVSQWLTTGEIAKVSDEQAKKWHNENTGFWANVVKPWVLIQPLAPADEVETTNRKIH